MEDEKILNCGHCNITLGNTNHIITGDIPNNHACFIKSTSLEIDYENGKIWGKMEATPISESSASNSCTDNDSQNWTDDMVKLLICAYNTYKDKFNSPMFNKKQVWELISSDLQKHGVYKTGIKCNEKWRNLKKTYDKVKNENKQTGNSTSHWKFFSEFQDIFFQDPHFHPVLTATSSGILKRRSETQEEKSSDAEEKNKENSDKQKIKKSASEGRRTISAYDIEKKRQKRHEEKMEQKERMFNWLKNYLEKE